MKKKKSAIIIGAAIIGALTFYGVSHAVKATPGIVIYNTTPNDYTTEKPTGCKGIVFPSPVKAGDRAGARIKIDSPPAGSCSTLYSSKYGNECTIALQTTSGDFGSVTLSASGHCKATGKTAVTITGSS